LQEEVATFGILDPEGTARKLGLERDGDEFEDEEDDFLGQLMATIGELRVRRGRRETLGMVDCDRMIHVVATLRRACSPSRCSWHRDAFFVAAPLQN
jgi:hypothetical protein